MRHINLPIFQFNDEDGLRQFSCDSLIENNIRRKRSSTTINSYYRIFWWSIKYSLQGRNNFNLPHTNVCPSDNYRV